MQTTIKKRLEYLRQELRAGRMSYGEIAELQDRAEQGQIDPGDTELLEAAGVPEFEEKSYPIPNMEVSSREDERMEGMTDDECQVVAEYMGRFMMDAYHEALEDAITYVLGNRDN